MRTAWSATEGLVPSFEFALAGTPCDQVLNEGRACFHRQGVAELFPREAGFEAYLGMPIVASDGRVLGHLALWNKQPLGDEVLVDRVYRIFLARAGGDRAHAGAGARCGGGAPDAIKLIAHPAGRAGATGRFDLNIAARADGMDQRRHLARDLACQVAQGPQPPGQRASAASVSGRARRGAIASRSGLGRDRPVGRAGHRRSGLAQRRQEVHQLELPALRPRPAAARRGTR